MLQVAASAIWPSKFLLDRRLHCPRPKPTSIWSSSRQPNLGSTLSPSRDQPIGAFLHGGMKPITTWKGEPGIFVVANGGAGLILIGQNGSADTQMPASSAFLFVRPREPPTLAKSHAPKAR